MEDKVKSYSLEEICEVLSGVSFGNQHYIKSGFPVLKIKDIQNNKIQTENLYYCDLNNHPNSNIVKNGDIVIATVGKGSIGKVGINLTNLEFLFTTGVFKLEPNPEILNKRYLYHFLLNCPEKIEKLITEGTIPYLSKAALKKLKISVPSLQDQEKIAHQLDRFLELKEELMLRKKQHDYYRGQIINQLSERTLF